MAWGEAVRMRREGAGQGRVGLHAAPAHGAPWVGCEDAGARTHQGPTTAAGTGPSSGLKEIVSLFVGQRVERGQFRLHFRWTASPLAGRHVKSRFPHGRVTHFPCASNTGRAATLKRCRYRTRSLGSSIAYPLTIVNLSKGKLQEREIVSLLGRWSRDAPDRVPIQSRHPIEDRGLADHPPPLPLQSD